MISTWKLVIIYAIYFCFIALIVIMYKQFLNHLENSLKNALQGDLEGERS